MTSQDRPDRLGLMLKKLLLLAVAAAAVVAYRNAVADKGGSYDPGAR
ncbi:hypothetical protein GCM10022234_15040 [Aeromicrobium panaciterrae]